MNRPLVELDVLNFNTESDHTGVQYGYFTLYDTMLTEMGKRGIRHRTGADIVFQMPIYAPRIEDREEWIYALTETPILPKHTAKRVQQADHLIVPNNTVAGWFRDGGITRPIHVCPLGYDPIYQYRPRDDRPDKMRILWLGSFTNRKMWVYALHAFWAAFDPDDDSVELYLKTTMPDQCAQINRVSNVVFDNRDIPRDKLRDLYYSAHVFLHTCSLEGYGLPPLEAMATGALVVAPSHGGMETFIRPDTAVMVPTVSAPMVQQESCWLSEDMVTINREVVDCWKPNQGALRELLAWAVSDYASTHARRRSAALWARDTLSWPRIVDHIVSILEENSAALNGGYSARTDIEAVPFRTLVHIFDPDLVDELPDPVAIAEMDTIAQARVS